MTSLFLVAGGHLWWIHRRVVSKALEDRDDAAEWRQALLSVGWCMIVVLLVNAQWFVKMNLLDWEVGSGVRGARLELLASHLGVLAGTSLLMSLVARALREPAVLAEPTPVLGAHRAMVVMVEKLLPRFWLAALGVGVVFGFACGRGLVLFMAAELTLCWAIGRVGLAVLRRRLQRCAEDESGGD